MHCDACLRLQSQQDLQPTATLRQADTHDVDLKDRSSHPDSHLGTACCWSTSALFPIGGSDLRSRRCNTCKQPTL